MASVLIDIAAEFVGKKAFKQADTATDKLTKNVKTLAKTFGLAFSTTAVLAYGKAAVRAAAADEKAQKQLALALKNVGLGRDAASSEDYIQRLQTEFGIVDDLLRPAYQTMAIATRDTAQAQKLFNLALDISAASGKDLASVSQALSRAYLGNNASLSRLGVGISKADLQAKSFEDIMSQLTQTFAGSATQAANTFQGSMEKLGVATANVQEIIGVGLIDALTKLGQNTSAADLATNMEKTAVYIADVIRGIGELSSKLKSLPVIGNFQVGMIPIIGSYIELLRKAGVQTGQMASADNAHLKSLQNQFAVTKKTVAQNKILTKETATQLKNKKLEQAINKANLALGKGEGVFDMEKIQIAAALENQAQALGKTTNAAQVLAIANDVARLNVKKSMLALEDAIASKDEEAITAATAKLNADLKILGALSGQTIKLADIKSILDSLKPKDLINQDNLNEALVKIKQMLKLLADMNGNINIKAVAATAGTGGGGGGGGGSTTTIPKTTTPTTVIPPAGSDIIPTIPITFTSVTAAEMAAVVEYAEAAAARADAVATLTDSLVAAGTAILAASSAMATVDIGSAATSSIVAGMLGGADFGSAVRGANYAAQAAASYNITVNTGVGDPNAIAEAINQVLIDAINRGTLTNQILNVA